MINLLNRKLNSEMRAKDQLRQLYEFLLPVRLYTDTYSANSVSDPVCGIRFKSAKYAGAMLKIGNKEYYFCSMECKTEFMKNPEKYWCD